MHHYFGTKDDLFLAAMELPIDPRPVIAGVVGGAGRRGERLLRAFLGVWDDPAIAPVLVGIVRSALEPGGERLLTQGFVPVVLLPAGAALGIDRPEVRMPLVVSQIARPDPDPLRVPPGADRLDVRRHPGRDVRPGLQRYLTGDVG